MVEQPEGAPRPQEERAVLILFDEMTYCSFGHSFAKYAVAFFNISRSMRASASSFLRRAFSLASSATDCSPGLPLRRAALAAPTQFPIFPLGIDSLFPVSFWVSPCSITIFTASAFSSALYLRCSFIASFSLNLLMLPCPPNSA